MKLENYEMIGTENTIADEIETRQNTSRKINRSMYDHVNDTNPANFNGMSLETLRSMKVENDHYLAMLYQHLKDISPFKNVVPVVLDTFQAGAIIYDSWGYDQTNIDFYCIVKRAGEFVTVLPMKKIVSAEIGFMTNDNMPGEIDFTAAPKRKKLKVFHGKESGFSMRDYAGGGWVSLFEGKPKNSTHYA